MFSGHVPVLLCTRKLAQSKSQYFFVLQNLHRARPSTTLYYKAYTKHVPARLCTTKLAQSTSQNYFILQSLHKAHPSTFVHSLHKFQKLKIWKRSFRAMLPSNLKSWRCEKHNSITHAAATTRNLDAATPLRSANNDSNFIRILSAWGARAPWLASSGTPRLELGGP